MTPIFTVAEMLASDARTIAAGTPGAVLMERAGAAVVEAITARWTPRTTVVLCGPGNNGGDGYVVARRLTEAGWPVRVLATTPVDQLRGDAAQAAARWAGETRPASVEGLQPAELIVDALFGAGLSRPLEPLAEALLRAAEAASAPLVAVDLPSGLAGDTGKPLGYAPRAALTVTFQAHKRAHVLEPGRSLCREIVVADIGVDLGPPSDLWLNTPELWAGGFPWPGRDAHKHARGRLGVVSGGVSATGAARLAARAGLRVGAGVVTVLTPPSALLVNAMALEAVMVRAFSDAGALAREAQTLQAAVIGPAAGVTAATRANVEALAATQATLVLDADALTVFRKDPARLFDLLRPSDVLTPHVGEFERVFPGLLADSLERITAARRAAERAGAVVLLKGPDTVIAVPDGRAAVNVNGAPWLATAGSGDVLAGLIGGLIAQGMDSFDAACAGAWIHAEAGSSFGPGLIAEDLPELIPGVLSGLWEHDGPPSGAEGPSAQ